MQNLLAIKYTSLHSKNEFYNSKEDYYYHLVIIDDNEKIKTFCDYLDHVKKQISNKKVYCSIDFEFNSKKIALCQICFEIPGEDRFIFFIYPPMFSLSEKNKLIILLIDIRIQKILHGSDSLDIPYLFNEFLIEDKFKKIFLMNFIDTKFLCEYSNLISTDKSKCKIYELLLNRKIITEDKYNELLTNDDKMGPIYEIFIDIKNLNHELIIYSLYDVVFLKDLVDSFENIDIIKEFTQFTLNYKNNLMSSQEEIINIINKINNNFIKQSNRIIRLNDLYQNFIKNINNNDLLIFNNINYFKRIIEILTKYIFYFNLTRTVDIYENSQIKNKIKMMKMIINKDKYPLITKIMFDINDKSYNFVKNI